MLPEYVLKYKKKGYKIVLKGNQYYLYRATSKRVEGLKNPQPIYTYLGIITQEGLVGAKTQITDIKVYEFGLCTYLLSVGKSVLVDYGDIVKVKAILATIYGIRIFQCHYDKSYLSILYPNIKINYATQTDKNLSVELIKRINNSEYSEMLAVSAALINHRWFLTNINDKNSEIMKKYDIKLRR